MPFDNWIEEYEPFSYYVRGFVYRFINKVKKIKKHINNAIKSFVKTIFKGWPK
ncbi:MAG: hypothetical protein ABFD07_16905 [Methanobacterium sp.]